MEERAREYQGDSLIGWHISHLFPDTSHLCRSPWQAQEGGRALEGCWQEFQGLLGFGWDILQPLLALSRAPTALGLALVLPKHDCPSSWKRKRAPDGVKQVENTFHTLRDCSALSATPLLGAGEHGALAQVGRRVCRPFPGGCWVPGWLSWTVGCQEVEQNRAGTAVHTEAGGLPFHRPGIHHLLLPSGSPTASALMTQFAFIS